MKAFTNPIVPLNSQNGTGTSDPYVIRHGGRYYHCYSRRDGVYISVCDDLSELDSAEKMKVYSCIEGKMGSGWYAPELHLIDGKWYIYGAPLINDKGWHCMTVLRATGDEPMCEYDNIGMIPPIDNDYNLDGTVFEYNNSYYFVWSSGWKLHIARMASPVALEGRTENICCSELPFETVSGPVCEGPAVLKRNGKIHIIYSANDSRDDVYCLGKLTFMGGDILDASSWKKNNEAVFKSTKKIFGPGHCSFTEDENGDTYIVYHANLVSGSGWNGRNVFAQKIEWNSEDDPIFGEPHF